MRTNILFSLAVVAVLSPLSHAATVVLDFEDRIAADPASAIPANYRGVNFSPDFFTYSDDQPPFTPSSGLTRAGISRLDQTITQASFTFTDPTAVFLGAFFSGAELPVHFELFHMGSLVHTSTDILPTEVPGFLDSGYSGLVDTVTIVAPNGPFFVFDDLTYQISAGPAVPGPLAVTGTLPLLGILCALRRRN